jgi:hypothetical protein
MELITAILLAGPIGYLVRDRRRSVVAYLALWAAVFPIQTISVSHEGHLVPLYWVVNALILCLGRAGEPPGRPAPSRPAPARRRATLLARDPSTNST